MEYFDVLDKNRKPLGYTKKRGEELEENTKEKILRLHNSSSHKFNIPMYKRG